MEGVRLPRRPGVTGRRKTALGRDRFVRVALRHHIQRNRRVVRSVAGLAELAALRARDDDGEVLEFPARGLLRRNGGAQEMLDRQERAPGVGAVDLLPRFQHPLHWYFLPMCSPPVQTSAQLLHWILVNEFIPLQSTLK